MWEKRWNKLNKNKLITLQFILEASVSDSFVDNLIRIFNIACNGHFIGNGISKCRKESETRASLFYQLVYEFSRMSFVE